MIKRDDIQSITTGSPDRLPKATGIPIRGNIKPAPAAAESTVSSIIPSEEDETKHFGEELLIGGDQPEPTGISAREKNRIIHENWLRNPNIPDFMDGFKENLLSLEKFYEKLDAIRSRKNQNSNAASDSVKGLPGITTLSPKNKTDVDKVNGPNTHTSSFTANTDDNKPIPTDSAKDEKPASDNRENPPQNTTDKEVKNDSRTQEAAREKQDKTNAADDRKEKTQEKKVETASKIKELDGKISNLGNEITQMTSDLEKLTEEKKGDPDFNPEPYLNEIFHKKLEMERLQTEKEQEKIKFEFLNAGKGSGIYEGETQTLTESANLDKLKDTRYNVQESIRKNLEFVEVHPDDHRRADLLPDRESREQGLTSAEKLSDLRDSIRENKKNQQ